MKSDPELKSVRLQRDHNELLPVWLDMHRKLTLLSAGRPQG